MDYSQRLHSAADPARFQGQSAQPETPTSTVPTPDEAKKGYSNTLQSAAAARTENTLPTAASRGSTLSQPAAAKANVYHGFVIPIKPTPPGAEDCCMSGCAHCVYDIYEEDRQDYKRELSAILKAIETAGLSPPPANIIGGATASGQAGKGADDDMDPSMKAFLELERKLKGT
ncbi:hypothetical protein BGZ98_002683 [Dissophora globulifera]|nr:hypothetical protein BGZ98_002683 [Dissophora globulifera]